MRTCKRCGTEFEGNFCHECGQKWTDSDICPQCGSELNGNVKFCSECGRRIDGEKEVSARSKIKKGGRSYAVSIHKILRLLPLALSVIFVVLLPLLYIAPLAYSNEMLGAAESVNVYSLDEDFYGVSVAYVVFMVLAGVLLLCLSKSKGKKYVKLFGNVRLSVVELVSLSAVVLIYLPCLIISAVAMSKVAELNEMLGGGLMDVLFVGAAPKAVLSFAVIFTVLAVGGVTAKVLLEKAYPELCPKCDNEEQQKATPCKKPFLYYAYLNARLRRVAAAFFVCSIITAIVSMGLFLFGSLDLGASYSRRLMIFVQLISVIGSVVTTVVVIVCMVFNSHDWSIDDFILDVQNKKWPYKCKLGIKPVIFYIIPLIVMISMYIDMLDKKEFSLYGQGFIILTVYIVVTLIVYVIAKFVIAKQSCALSEYLCGAEEAQGEAPLQIKFNKEKELATYQAYIMAKKQGVVIKDDDNTKKAIFRRRLILSLVCCVFVVILVVNAVVPQLLLDIFSASYVSRAVYTYKDYGTIYAPFGKPNEIRALGEEKEYGANTCVATYYDDDYAKLNKKVEQLQKQIDKALGELDMNKVSKLNAELQSLKNRVASKKFKSLTITLTVKSKEYKGNNEKDKGEVYYTFDDYIKVALDTNTMFEKTSQKKTAKCVTMLGVIKYNEDGYRGKGFYVEIFYTDGSYKYEFVTTDLLSGVDFTKSGKQTVKWSDEWGSYSATVTSE